jgi:hypothetical protein
VRGSRALLHIGTHKTGSTSFQQWALTEAAALRQREGVALYESHLGWFSHSEFPLLCMRPNRGMHRKISFPDWCLDEWQAEAHARIRSQVEQADVDLLISSENLSLLRHGDELDALARLLEPRDVQVVVCVRDPAAYLDSYRRMMAARGDEPSRYAESFQYVEPDTWLLDFDALISAYRRAFGTDNVAVFDYEAALERYGSTIPCVLDAFAIDPEAWPSWRGVWTNTAPAPPSRRQRARRRASRMFGALWPE